MSTVRQLTDADFKLAMRIFNFARCRKHIGVALKHVRIVRTHCIAPDRYIPVETRQKLLDIIALPETRTSNWLKGRWEEVEELQRYLRVMMDPLPGTRRTRQPLTGLEIVKTSRVLISRFPGSYHWRPVHKQRAVGEYLGYAHTQVRDMLREVDGISRGIHDYLWNADLRYTASDFIRRAEPAMEEHGGDVARAFTSMYPQDRWWPISRSLKVYENAHPMLTEVAPNVAGFFGSPATLSALFGSPVPVR